MYTKTILLVENFAWINFLMRIVLMRFRMKSNWGYNMSNLVDLLQLICMSNAKKKIQRRLNLSQF